MAITNVITLIYTVQDAKGKKGRINIHFPISAVNNLGIGVLDDFARTTATLIDTLLLGKVIAAKTTITYDLSGETIKAAPLPNSDVEEGAVFNWLCNGLGMATHTKMRLPTFDEAFYYPGSQEVITNPFDPNALPDVLAFTARMEEGRTLGLINVSPSDNHGVDIVLSLGGHEQFFKYAADRFD